LLSWGEQDTCVIMRRTRYICYHEENKIHLLSWGEQDTFVIMGRTRYICYHRENKIHLLSWGEQDTFFSNSCSIFTLPNPCENKSIINVWITLFSVADWVR
jgi:hypothetical protein